MVNVAILGYGVVGSGVAEVLTENAGTIDRRAEGEIRVKYILVRRDFPDSPFQDRMVRDFSVIENDPEVDVVVEVMGGAGAAKDYTERALRAGKSVVTANKELVAEHGCALLKLAQEHGVSYLFEASVGGGIPIIHPLSQCLAANEIEEITGILNGTTNYILTRMIRGNLSFEAALGEAQEKGYAEADPTADVEGIDAAGRSASWRPWLSGGISIPARPGQRASPVSRWPMWPMQRRAAAGSSCWAGPSGGRTASSGSTRRPIWWRRRTLWPEWRMCSMPLRSRATPWATVIVYGRGAGKRPTASAVVADVMDVARHLRNKPSLHWDEGGEDTVAPADELESRWYVRLEDAGDLPNRAEELFRSGAPAGERAFLMPAMSAPALEDALKNCGRPALTLRVLD